MKKFVKLTAVFVLLATVLTGCSRKKDENLIRVGMLTGHVIPVVAKEKGYFAEQGLTNVELYVFGGGPAEIEAFTSGDLDVIFTGDLPAYNGINNGLDLRFIGNYSSSYKTNALIVRDSAGIKTFADLKGKKLAVPFGTNIQALLYEYLEAGGLTADDAGTILNLGCPDAVNALRQGDVDAIVVWNPWVQLVRKEEGISVLADTTDFRNFVCPISAAAQYIEDHPETVKRLLAALDGASKWIIENKEEAAGIAGDYYQISDTSSILIGLQDNDITTKLSDDKVEALRQGAYQNYRFGLIKKEIDVDKHVRQDLTANLK